jgi:D-glycero-alpha-D-manno-heptose-7-phosphate kinase
LESIHIEQDILKETVGSQDQALAAYGGLNHISFLTNGDISVRPVVSSERVKELNSHMMLFYSGIKRTASNIADSFVGNIEDKKRQLRIMKDLVDESISILNSAQDIRGFGDLMHEAWQFKKDPEFNGFKFPSGRTYEQAMSAGALGN